MNVRYRHVIWDWNGTLLDDASACVETLNVILDKRGLPGVTLQKYRDVFTFPVRKYYEILGMDFSDEDWDLLAREFHTIYDMKSPSCPVRKEVPDILAQLRELSVAVSVLSASEQNTLEKILRDRGLREQFVYVAGCGDIYAHSKLEAGRELVKEIGLPPEEILLVGDTIHDHEVAIELGCAVVLIADGHQARDRLEACGCPVLKGIDEVIEIVGSVA